MHKRIIGKLISIFFSVKFLKKSNEKKIDANTWLVLDSTIRDNPLEKSVAMPNLFYDCLPFELQHNILIFSCVGQIKQHRMLYKKNFTKPGFVTIYEKTHGRGVPKCLTREVLNKSNFRLYWHITLSSVNHMQMKSNPILFMKYMKHKTLIDMCITNGLQIKKNWSKQNLISHLMKI